MFVLELKESFFIKRYIVWHFEYLHLTSFLLRFFISQKTTWFWLGLTIIAISLLSSCSKIEDGGTVTRKLDFIKNLVNGDVLIILVVSYPYFTIDCLCYCSYNNNNNSINNNENIDFIKETVKQKMQLKAQRLRRSNKRIKCYELIMIFKTEAKKP